MSESCQGRGWLSYRTLIHPLSLQPGGDPSPPAFFLSVCHPQSSRHSIPPAGIPQLTLDTNASGVPEVPLLKVRVIPPRSLGSQSLRWTRSFPIFRRFLSYRMLHPTARPTFFIHKVRVILSPLFGTRRASSPPWPAAAFGLGRPFRRLRGLGGARGAAPPAPGSGLLRSPSPLLQ